MPVVTHTPVNLPISDPDGIIDLTAAEGAEVSITDTVATSAAADPVTAPLTLEIFLAYEGDKALINYKPWRNFWISAGSHLSDYLSSAGHALFGVPSDSVTHDELRLSSNLAAHVAMHASRQMFGSINGRLRVQAHRLAIAVNNTAAHVRHNAAVAHSEALHVDAHAQQLHAAAVAYANARAHNVGVEAEQYARDQTQGLKQWTIDHISTPVQHELDDIEGAIATQAEVLKSHQLHIGALTATVATLAAGLHQAEGSIGKLATEAEECTEPMCETVGPKSDWGKLLKKFGPTAIWALLAEMAALHPEEIERISEDLAHALGPVLQRFAEAWIGVLPGGTGTEVAEVESHVGKFNPLSLG